jgi:hypothetical protein
MSIYVRDEDDHVQTLREVIVLRDERIEQLEADWGKERTVFVKQIEQLEALAFAAYCAGYERGHSDTVEYGYMPPAEYPEEWAETRKELLEDLLPTPEDETNAA